MKRVTLKFLMVILLSLVVFSLSACQPTVVEDDQVVVRDNTKELEALQDEVDGLRGDISDLLLIIEALELTVTTETVDLTEIEAELERITSEYDWIEDELEAMRQWNVSKEEYYTAVAAYLSELAEGIEIPESPARNLYLQVGDDWYLIWINDEATYTMKFTYTDPLIGDTVLTMQWISKEIDYNLDGQFTFDIVYGETTHLYTTTITETVTVLSVIDSWYDYDIGIIAEFYTDVRTCVLANTCATDVPSPNITE